MLNQLKEKCRNAIKNKKLNVFLGFFFISFGFLMLAKLSKTYILEVPYTISLTNKPQHLNIDTDSLNLTLTLKSYGFNLLYYRLFSQNLEIDLKKEAIKGKDDYIWDSKKGVQKIKEELGSSVEVLEITPDPLTIPFQKLMVKKIPVLADTKISFAPGYHIPNEITITPDSVEVIAAAPFLLNINHIQTEPIVLSEVNKDININAKLLPVHKTYLIQVSTKTVNIAAKVKPFTEGVEEVPVSIMNLPKGKVIKFFPKTVSVVYKVSLDNYKKITATDFKVECDYNDIIDKETSVLIPKLVKSPQTIKEVRIKQTKIDFIIVE